MTINERLNNEYFVYSSLASTLSFDHSVMPKDHFSKELVKVYRGKESTKDKISYFEDFFKPILNDENRVLKYKELIDSQDVFELLYDKDVKRYIEALYFSKENDVFNELDMLKAINMLIESKKRQYLYETVSKPNFSNFKKNIEKIKHLVK